MTTHRISYFPSETERVPRPLDVTWDQLTAQLSSPVVAPCTLETCGKGDHALIVDGKVKGCRHKYIALWSPAAYPAGSMRGKKNVSAVSLLVLDLDHMTDEQIVEVAERLQPYKYIAHATHGDRPGDRALRVILELSAPVTGADWPRFWSTVVAELGVPVDPQTCDASRLYFLPSRPGNGDFLHDTNEGASVDTAAVLAKAPPPIEATPIAISEVAVASLEDLQAAAVQLAAAWPAKGRHFASLALAGALAQHGWPEETIATFIAEVTRLAGGEPELDKRRQQATDSVAKISRGEVVSGWGSLAQSLTRPDAVSVVRERLGMRDAEVAAFDSIFEPPPPTEEPSALVTGGYPDLSGLSLVGAAPPRPAPPPGSWMAILEQARADVARELGTVDDLNEGAEPFFEPARDLFAKDYPPTPWLVRGLIPEGGVAVILAPPKSTKSWLAIELAACVSSGIEALVPLPREKGDPHRFEVPRARPTAYFFAEDMGPSIRNRLRAFAEGRGMRPEDLTANLHVQPRGRSLDLLRDEDLARLVASCRKLGPIGFLVLDPLRDIQTGEENSSDDMGSVMRRLKLIGRLLSTPDSSCTVLVLHHAKRAKAEDLDDNRPGSDARGSSAIEGAADAIVSLRDLQGDETVFTNTVASVVKNAKSAGKFPLTLTIEDDQYGTAKRAAWKTSERLVKTSSEGNDDRYTILKAMLSAEQLRKPIRTRDEIRTTVKKNAKDLGALLESMVEVGQLKRGPNGVGYYVTEQGRAWFDSITTSMQTP